MPATVGIWIAMEMAWVASKRQVLPAPSAITLDVLRIHAIVNEERAITADTAERLAVYFGGDAASWMALQAEYELKTLPNRDVILREVHPRAAMG